MFEPVGNAVSVVGEAPIWHPEERVLYFVDIRGRFIRRYDPQTGDETSVPTPELLGCIAARAGGGVYAATQTGIFSVSGGRIERVVPTPDVPDTHRFNDGTQDTGRLCCMDRVKVSDPLSPGTVSRQAA